MSEPANLRLLRRLVTVLTAVMILGLLAVVVTFVMRFPTPGQVAVPEGLALPAGVTVAAYTQGPDWAAVVTDDGRILIFHNDGRLRQEVRIEPVAQ
ncbi:MAG: DUF6476 family protein [Pseudomonadota bacterium]